MTDNYIYIKGAREHNLKNVDIKIPRDKLVVMTGLSGSGKSSLAFDTIYAEGQRRYVESLSSYVRQFLGLMEKPNVDYIEGLSPAISIDQKTTGRNPRSTVGTVTEIYDYLRLLYARIGTVHCPNCGIAIKQQTIDQICDSILEFHQGTKFMILAPVIRGRKGEYAKIFSDAKKSGYVRVRVDGIMYELTETIQMEKNKKHTIEIVIDRLVVKDGIRKRLTDSLENALTLAGGLVIINVVDGEDHVFSQNYACHKCGINMEEPEPRSFSFNNPFGACATCGGLGYLLKMDPERIIVDKNLSILQGAIRATGWNINNEDSIAMSIFESLSIHYGFDLDEPLKNLPEKIWDIIFYGTKDEKITVTYRNKAGSGTYKTTFEGIINNLERRYRETSSDWMRVELEGYMSNSECFDCHGARLKKEVLAVTVGDVNIDAITHYPIHIAKDFFEGLELDEQKKLISKQILKEIIARLNFLNDVGLDYLTLSRSAATLSGGEAQRIRLATQIGSGLRGVIYILDEPSIGLHQRDNNKLLKTLYHLRDLGNTLVVVEHDEDTMLAADHIIDIGPGAGIHGGKIVAQGSVDDIKGCDESLTGQYLSRKKLIEVPNQRRAQDKGEIEIRGARQNNLKNINVKIPLGNFISVTGVSGSGKSSLINEILYKSLSRKLNHSKIKAGKHDEIIGVEQLDKIVDIDQSPIGRTPRSNPATYIGVFSDIRNVFSSTVDARMRGFGPGRFSFNVKGGRCEACKGDGIIKIEMHFLPDVYVPCEVCIGKRYNRETLEILYKGKSIHDVLEMTVEEGIEFFENIPKIKNKLQVMSDVGLSYIKIGQPSTTLSGGEAQRVKLVTELSRKSTSKTIYVLDEPTTGLHTADVHRLVGVLNTLVENGNTVVVIEHNLDVIKISDYIIDLGPVGGDKGGMVIAEGTPEQVIKNKQSVTGEYLKRHIERDRDLRKKLKGTNK